MKNFHIMRAVLSRVDEAKNDRPREKPIGNQTLKVDCEYSF